MGFPLLTIVAFILFLSAPFHIFSADIDIVALVPGCGDGVVSGGESCDGSEFDGKTCVSQGFTSGTLSCTAACTVDVSGCVSSSGGGGGGGGGGGRSSRSVKATVVFEGRAYPSSKVVILKDGQIVAETVASSLANFQVSMGDLSAGSYAFSVYGEDASGVRSSVLLFPLKVTRGVVAKIDGVFIAPTVAVDKSQVRKGDTITIFGHSVPAASVTLEVHSGEPFFVQTAADTHGVYLHNFDTAVLAMGEHTTRSKSSTSTEISPFSKEVDFTVGTENVAVKANSTCPQKADMNGDCRVNLIDFSIVTFWFNKPLTDSFVLREKEKLSGDGRLTIVDLSIMGFYWTG